jgi:hypothetical protein
MKLENFEIYDNTEVRRLPNISEISFYNNNYHIGLKRREMAAFDLLFAESDDMDTTIWYVVTKHGFMQIGYSVATENPEVIHYETEILT